MARVPLLSLSLLLIISSSTSVNAELQGKQRIVLSIAKRNPEWTKKYLELAGRLRALANKNQQIKDELGKIVFEETHKFVHSILPANADYFPDLNEAAKIKQNASGGILEVLGTPTNAGIIIANYKKWVSESFLAQIDQAVRKLEDKVYGKDAEALRAAASKTLTEQKDLLKEFELILSTIKK